MGIAFAYWRDTRNGIERSFFSEGNSDFSIYVGMPILVGFMVILLTTVLASPIWGLFLLFT